MSEKEGKLLQSTWILAHAYTDQIRCDGRMPACTHCIDYKTECVFTQVEKKRSPPKG